MSVNPDYDVLHAIRDLLRAETSFFQNTRFLDGRTRNHIIAAYLRNNNMILNLLQTYNSNETATMVINFGDISGNFMEPVPVLPTRAQVDAAVERHIGVTSTNCSICQDSVSCATRIRHCGHCFHSSCIEQWFSMNPRCPVCRYDIRDGLSANPPNPSNEDSGMHSDEE